MDFPVRTPPRSQPSGGRYGRSRSRARRGRAVHVGRWQEGGVIHRSRPVPRAKVNDGATAVDRQRRLERDALCVPMLYQRLAAIGELGGREEPRVVPGDRDHGTCTSMDTCVRTHTHEDRREHKIRGRGCKSATDGINRRYRRAPRLDFGVPPSQLRRRRRDGEAVGGGSILAAAVGLSVLINLLSVIGVWQESGKGPRVETQTPSVAAEVATSATRTVGHPGGVGPAELPGL